MRDDWSLDELVASWTLVGQDWELIGNKTGATRLGFALMLKFFELEARFPSAGSDFAEVVVGFVAMPALVCSVLCGRLAGRNSPVGQVASFAATPPIAWQ